MKLATFSLLICLSTTIMAKPYWLSQIWKRDVGESSLAGKVFVWNQELYPDPQNHPANCGRERQSYICNPDKIITEQEAIKLDFAMSKIKNETVCLCPANQCPPSGQQGGGITIAIALMKNLALSYNEDSYARARAFAAGLVGQWNVGKCKDHIVLLLASENAEVIFAVKVGESVSKVITPEQIESIVAEIQGHFKVKNYYVGLESMVQSIWDKLKVVQHAPQWGGGGQDEVGESNIGMTIGLVVGFIALAALFTMGIIYLRSKRVAYVAAQSEDRKTSIVKTPVVFPDAVYQPCSIEDPHGNYPKRQTSDEELNFEEYAAVAKQQDGAANGPRRELSAVEEELELQEKDDSSQENVEFQHPKINHPKV